MPIKNTSLVASADIGRVVQGEALAITAEIYDEVSSQVLDLAGATAVVATFPGTPDANGAPTTVTATLGAGVALDTNPGRLVVTLSAVKTAALKVGEGQGWQLKITLADASIRIVQLIEQLDVVASLF